MDAIDVLMMDHQRVRTIFQQFATSGNVVADTSTFGLLFAQLAKELSLHAVIEENNFYPALATLPDLAQLVKESYHEHAGVKVMVGELAQLDPTSSDWQTRLTALMQAVTHHLDEEEQQLFPQVRQKFSNQRLQELGLQLEQARVINLPGVLTSLPMQVQQVIQIGMSAATAAPATIADGSNQAMSGQAMPGMATGGQMLSGNQEQPSTNG